MLSLGEVPFIRWSARVDFHARFIPVLGTLAACGAFAAPSVGGSWDRRVELNGETYLYEVNLVQHQQELIGNWSVEASRSSGGCLHGRVQHNAVSFRTCTIDGSAGSRDMKALCPEYHTDQNRFVLRGSKLAWEVWDDKRRSWRPFVLLERAENERPVSWDEERYVESLDVRAAGAL